MNTNVEFLRALALTDLIKVRGLNVDVDEVLLRHTAGISMLTPLGVTLINVKLCIDVVTFGWLTREALEALGFNVRSFGKRLQQLLAEGKVDESFKKVCPMIDDNKENISHPDSVRYTYFKES